MGLSRPLRYPPPTTDQEVHQIRTCICKMLAAAAKDGKLLLQPSRPRRDHTNAPRKANTYIGTLQANPSPQPLPLQPHSPTSGSPAPTDTQNPRSRNTGPPLPPERPDTPHRPPRPASLAGTNPHTPAASIPTPHGTPMPPSDPHMPPTHSPATPDPSPLTPECSPRELFPPADADAARPPTLQEPSSAEPRRQTSQLHASPTHRR